VSIPSEADSSELHPVAALEIRSDGGVVFHGSKTTGATKANMPDNAYRITAVPCDQCR
jgi:hypothetical protein